MTTSALPQAVVFDFYGTLTDPSRESRRRALIDSTAAALGVDAMSYWAATSKSFDQRCRGELGDTRATLQELARRCGHEVDEPALDRAVDIHLRAYRDLTVPHPRAVGVLGWLREVGCRVGVLTDCSTELPEIWAETLWPSHVDAVVFSAVVGHRKPSPAGYLDVSGQLGVHPSDCWFVGDGGSGEHLGAKAVGMRPVLVANALYDVAHLRVDPDAYRPTDVIDDLGDLPSLLREPDVSPA